MKIKMVPISGVLAVLSALSFSANADLITTSSGRTIKGTVVQTNKNDVLILADYGTVSLPANVVQSIKQENDGHPTTLSTNTVSTPGRLPNWRSIISQLADKAWAENLRQIPATVVTNGILKNVPYISFRCGIDYEVNVYGDLDNPAGIEVGMYRALLTKSYAKENSIAFVTAVLQRESDRTAAQKLNRDKDKVRKDGLTLEVTPESAEDSYGGWWISAYDEKALEQARATDKEIQAISVLNSAIIKSTPASTASGWTQDDLKYARANAIATSLAPASTYTAPTYSTDTSPYPDVLPQHNHGSVYVHSYYRRDGTYVHAYTRRR